MILIVVECRLDPIQLFMWEHCSHLYQKECFNQWARIVK